MIEDSIVAQLFYLVALQQNNPESFKKILFLYLILSLTAGVQCMSHVNYVKQALYCGWAFRGIGLLATNSPVTLDCVEQAWMTRIAFNSTNSNPWSSSLIHYFHKLIALINYQWSSQVLDFFLTTAAIKIFIYLITSYHSYTAWIVNCVFSESNRLRLINHAFRNILSPHVLRYISGETCIFSFPLTRVSLSILVVTLWAAECSSLI